MNAAFSALLASAIFLLLYFDEAEVGVMRLGYAWKFALVAYLFYLAVRTPRYSLLFVIGLLLFLKSALYVYQGPENLAEDLSESFKLLFLPLVFEAARKSGTAPATMQRLIFLLAAMLAASAAPFLLGLPEPSAKENHSLIIYGLDSGFEFSGAFGNKHNAAVALSCSALILIHFLEVSKSYWRRLGIFLLITIALIGLYKTYARTGMLYFLAGFLVFLFWNRGATLRFRSLAIVLAGLLIVAIAYQSSPVFQMRMLGQNMYHQSSGIEIVSSGRTVFWTTVIDNWTERPLPEQLLGIGLEKSKDDMHQKIGMRIFAHNGFLDSMQASGLIGLLLFVMLIIVYCRTVASSMGSAYGRLNLALLAGYISMLFVQGGAFFWASLLIGLALGAAAKKSPGIGRATPFSSPSTPPT